MRYMPLAIKMMKHDMAMNAGFLDTFQKEAKILKLPHQLLSFVRASIFPKVI
jgi:hypothetical protein